MTVRQWLRTKAVEPLLSMARAGASSTRTLSRSFGVGFSVGLCPVVGLPMPVLLLVLASSKLLSSSTSFTSPSSVAVINAPALLVGNAVSLPAELLMLGPYLRAGRFLRDSLGGGEGEGGGGGGVASSLSSSMTSGALVAAAKEHARKSIPAALLVWALSVPFVSFGVAAALEPWLARAVDLSSSASSSHARSHPHAPSSSRGTSDVELAPLAAAPPSPSRGAT